MRSFIIILVLAAVAVGFVGYKRDWFKVSSTHDAKQNQYTVTVDKDNWTKDRDDFQKQAEVRLKELDLSIDKLNEKAKDATAEAKVSLNKTAEELKKKRDAAAEEMKHLSTVTEEKWQETKKRVGDSIDELKAYYDSKTSHHN